MTRNILILLPLFSVVFPNSKIVLNNGYYVESKRLDTVEVNYESEQIFISTKAGEISIFKLNADNLFLRKNFVPRNSDTDNNYSFLKIDHKDKFSIIYEDGAPLMSFTLVERPGFLNKLLAVLLGSALLTSFIQAYLKINKLWKRRKIEEVANSISIVASLLGFAVLFPFLLNSLFVTQDYPAAIKSLIGLVLATMFSLISIGYFIDQNKGKGILSLLLSAISAEKGESTDLISAMLRPHGAKKIIDILIKLAAIDDDVAQEEIDLINEFATKWNIDIPDLKTGKPDGVTNLVELKSLFKSYLDEKPDVEIAKGLTDLINRMAEADEEVTREEAMAISEFSGMISHYVNKEKGGSVDMFEVNIVPQGDHQIRAINELLPGLESVKDRGGEVFKVGKFFSEDYAEAVCTKYISLGLYSSYVRVKSNDGV